MGVCIEKPGMPTSPSKLAQRNARLELYVRWVCDAWDANQVGGVTAELNRCFAEEEKHCPSTESRCKYIYYGVDSSVQRRRVVRMAHGIYDEIDPQLFTLRCCDQRMHRHKKLECIQRKVEVCCTGKLVVFNARHFLDHMTRIAESLMIEMEITCDVVSMARHCLEFALCLRRNETARSKHRTHVPSSNGFSVGGRVVIHTGASKSDADSSVRPPFAKVSLFDERLTAALIHLVFGHTAVNDECFSASQRNSRNVANEWLVLVERYAIPRYVESASSKLEPRSFPSIGASYLAQLYGTDMFRNQSESDVELARRILCHQSRDPTVTNISNVLHGDPCTKKVGIVRHVARVDLDEGSAVFPQYDEDGATAVAVAPTVLTKGGKRRRVSVPFADQETQPPAESE